MALSSNIYDINSPTYIDPLKAFIEDGTLPDNALATVNAAVDKKAAELSGNYTAPFNINTVTVSSGGDLAVSAQGKRTVIYVNAFNTLVSDTISTITGTNFSDGFELLCVNANDAQTLTWNAPNMKAPGFKTRSKSEWVHFTYVNGVFVQGNSYPTDWKENGWAEVFVNGGVLTLPIGYTNVQVRGELSAETRATGAVTITAAGSAGTIFLYAEDGNDTFALGYYEISGASSTTLVAMGLFNNVTANSSSDLWYAVNLSSNTFDAQAPAGSGVTGNSYTIHVVTTGGITATPTAVTNLTGGADGTESIDTITDINNAIEGVEYRLYNNNTTSPIVFGSGGNLDSNMINKALLIGAAFKVALMASTVISLQAQSMVYSADVTLTSAQILALNGTPIQLIPAPGAGLYIEVVKVTARADWSGATTAYATNTTFVIRNPSAGTNSALWQASDGELLLSTTTRVGAFKINDGFVPAATTSTTIYENEKVEAFVDAGNPTAGDFDINIRVLYYIHAW